MRRGYYGAVTVTRLHPFPANKRNLWARAMGFIGLTGLATLVGLTIRGPFAGVVAVSPPLTFGAAGWLLARRHRCPLVFNVQDVFPDVAVEVGAIRSPRAIRFFRWMERITYRRADAVTVLSEDLATNVVAKLTGSETRCGAQSVGNQIVRPVVKVIPNFVDVDAIRPAVRMTEYRREHGLGDRTVVMYAGNLGHSQSLDLVIGAADRHRDRPDLVYVLNGGGYGLMRCVAQLSLDPTWSSSSTSPGSGCPRCWPAPTFTSCRFGPAWGRLASRPRSTQFWRLADRWSPRSTRGPKWPAWLERLAPVWLSHLMISTPL